MENRKDVEDLVAAPEIDARLGLGRIGQDVAVGQHDALGRSLRSGCEQDGGGIVGFARHHGVTGRQQAAHPIGETDGGAHVLEIDEPDVAFDLADERGEPALLDKGARGDHRLDLGGAAGGPHIGRA